MIRAFLAFLEARGAGDVLASELRDALASDGNAGRVALVASGVIAPGPPATTRPCEGADCAREVRERSRAPSADGGRRYLAVCTRHPRECETEQVSEAELAQETIVESALLDVVRRALRIDPPLDASPPPRAGEPIVLGEQVHDGVARDVYFVRKPRGPALRTLLAERRAAPRPTWVLVPTARGIDPETLAKHGEGHVAIEALTDALTVHHGNIVAAPRLRAVAPKPRATAARAKELRPRPRATKARRSAALDRLPPATRWGEITFYGIDDERAIGVAIAGRHRRLSAEDLGMTSTRTSEPVRAFVLLKRICDGNGVFDTRPWGGRENGKQIVSELRRALSAAFAIEGSPIEAYSRGAKSWKTRFRAFVVAPKEMGELAKRTGREG